MEFTMEFTCKDPILERNMVSGRFILMGVQFIPVLPDSEPCHI